MTNTVEVGTGELLAYLSRLTGEPLTAGTPVQLRSVHRAALTSWARKQGVPVRLAVLSAGVPFTVADLLEGGPSAVSVPAVKVGQPVASASGQVLGGLGAVGVDIEEVDGLPEATDFREHPFFQDNFTPAEIAHAIRQGDVRASLCGIWAAKEAVLKAGLATVSAGALRGIEITWDTVGRPMYPGAQLSVSHTPRTAVAMCVAAAAPAAVVPIPVVTPVERSPAARPPVARAAEAPVKRGRWPWSRAKA